MFRCRRSLVLLPALLLLAAARAGASPPPVPAGLEVDPGMVTQGDGPKTTLKTVVRLPWASPGYFICEIRSPKRAITCTTIIFKKGDVEGEGSATVDWSQVTIDTEVKLSAFNVEAPDKTVYFTVKLHKKPDEDNN